jgi:GNAT superfamily N-acetyltransferase
LSDWEILELKKTKMEIQIRKATDQDASAIADLLRSMGLFAHINAETPHSTREHVSRHLGLCQADDSHSVFVALDTAGEIVGYCAVHWLPYLLLPGPEGYVSELFLRESSRSLGIGGQLLETAKAEAKERGCSRLMLLNLHNRESYKRGFYKKQGWEERQEAANFILNMQDQS